MSISCQIHAMGACVPHEVLTNSDIARFVDTSNEWIVERTGICQRHKVGGGENASDLGLKAVRKALDEAAFDAANLTHIVCATCTPDHLAPSVACIIAGQLDVGPIMAYDISSACAGFIYGLSNCRAILAAEPDSKIMLVCVETLTRRLNWHDRSTCVLFGDAASACLISSQSPALYELRDVICQSDGKQKDLIIVGGGTSCQYDLGSPVTEEFFISMQGRDTYKHAVRNMVNVCEQILRRNHLYISDIDLFVPHQANLRIIEAVGARLKIDSAKVFTNVAEYGNTSSASIPLALQEAHHAGRIPKDGLVLVSAFGAGLTWGAALLKF